MTKKFLLFLTLVTNLQAAEFHFQETPIKLHNQTELAIREIEGSYQVLCRYQKIDNEASCGKNVRGRLERDGQGNFVLPSLIYQYDSGNQRHISMQVNLQARGENIVFNQDTTGMKIRASDYKKALANISIYSLYGNNQLKTVVDGYPLEKWLEKNHEESLRLLMWVKVGSGAPLVLHRSIKKNKEGLSAEFRYAGFSGVLDQNSIMKIDMNVLWREESLYTTKASFPFARSLPKESLELNLSTAKVNQDFRGRWIGTLNFSESGLKLPKEEKVYYYTGTLIDFACDQSQRLTGSLRTNYKVNRRTYPVQIEITGNCEGKVVLGEIKDFPIIILDSQDRQFISVEKKDLTLVILSVAGKSIQAILTDSDGKEVGEYVHNRRLKN